MFTQIIAQGHFKRTRIDNKNVHLNFGSCFFVPSVLVTYSFCFSVETGVMSATGDFQL